MKKIVSFPGAQVIKFDGPKIDAVECGNGYAYRLEANNLNLLMNIMVKSNNADVCVDGLTSVKQLLDLCEQLDCELLVYDKKEIRIDANEFN